MCSIAAIPSERILGHSPPVYGPLLYSSLMVTTPPITTRSVPPRIRPCLSTGSIQLDGFLKGSDDVVGGSEDGSGRRKKKSVVFADDRGRPLTYVRVMSEPSNVPPLWTSSYVAKLARGDIFQFPEDPAISRLASHLGGVSLGRSSSEPTSPDALDGSCSPLLTSPTLLPGGQNSPSDSEPAQIWEVCFAQPASDYLAFRNKLERNSVCLENVIVRESERQIVGTVKVKNLAYDKRVSVRHTCDGWASYCDTPCLYVEQPGLAAQQSPVKNLYDTFRFQIALPSTTTPVIVNSSNSSSSSSNNGTTSISSNNTTSTSIASCGRLEFCVRFQTPECEFWDNNETRNYAIVKRRDVMMPMIVNVMPQQLLLLESHQQQQQQQQQQQLPASVVSDQQETTNNNGTTTPTVVITSSSTPIAISSTPSSQQQRRNHRQQEQNLRAWSEFAAWQHHAMENESPYW